MKKRLSALLLAALLLLCLCLTACTPAAEVTPTPTPTLEVTPTPTLEPTPTPTPEPTPTPPPEPSSAPVRHDWSGNGYSYTSGALGIRVEFPPDWGMYFTFVEEEHTYANFIDQDGNPVEPWTATHIVLWPKGFTIEWEEDLVLPLASIGFIPKGLEPNDDEDGGLLTLLETEGGAYVCGMFGQIRFLYEFSLEDSRGVIINEVQDGIQDGRWEIEILDPKS